MLIIMIITIIIIIIIRIIIVIIIVIVIVVVIIIIIIREQYGVWVFFNRYQWSAGKIMIWQTYVSKCSFDYDWLQVEISIYFAKCYSDQIFTAWVCIA